MLIENAEIRTPQRDMRQHTPPQGSETTWLASAGTPSRRGRECGALTKIADGTVAKFNKSSDCARGD